MGDRGNIKLEYSEGSHIYFYTHWSGSELEGIIAEALKRGESRWTDESYLARIIFSELIKDQVLETTGYGIAPYECEQGSPLWIINLKENTVTEAKYNKVTSFERFVQAKEEKLRC